MKKINKNDIAKMVTESVTRILDEANMIKIDATRDLDPLLKGREFFAVFSNDARYSTKQIPLTKDNATQMAKWLNDGLAQGYFD